ncbi:MAG: L,D-transpeptidase family protein [Proteobacteria bacterium]|nr:L,D-transpeptidase family protein [Pseudomonadota bacterium]MBS0546359.1 L,D-transpeptidase family protein [Pseudomonadota bacterium]
MSDDGGLILTVQADSADSALGWAVLGARRWRCVVGAGGIREDKVEGDGATPVGTFPLRHIYYRNDRLVLPKPIGLPARPISQHDGWCDDPRSDSYNRLVRTPNDWSHEKMWREDGLYDLVVVVGYNDDPPEGEWGSAIFLHIARDDKAGTQGCIAFAREDLLELLPLITAQTRLRVLSHPANEQPGPPSEDEELMKEFEDFDEKDWS